MRWMLVVVLLLIGCGGAQPDFITPRGTEVFRSASGLTLTAQEIDARTWYTSAPMTVVFVDSAAQDDTYEVSITCTSGCFVADRLEHVLAHQYGMWLHGDADYEHRNPDLWRLAERYRQLNNEVRCK